MGLGWLVVALFYLGGLFWLGRWGDKPSKKAKTFTGHATTYALALAIYCTAWTYFGAVGEAARNGWNYLPILLGPILLYLFGYRFLYKLILVSKKQHITTIADFIASRYGKRQAVALMVTVIALLATVPYIALQLKAIGAAFVLVSGQQSTQSVVLLAAAFIGLFCVYFGTQRADVTEYRRGMMLTIAFESLVKLFALSLVAFVAYWYMFRQGQAQVVGQFVTVESLSTFTNVSFWAQTLLAAGAIICLPRQFHVAIIDNLDIKHLKTARWLFPLYLLSVALVIPMLASSGQVLLTSSNAQPDTYVLNLAMLSESVLIQGLVYLGGLSAATAMIIVATLTLSTMVTNDVILPKLLTRDATNRDVDHQKQILKLRRVVIGGILAMAYLYHQQLGSNNSLASIGLVAFSLVVQLLPAIVGGLYWQRGHAHGVYGGLLTGLVVWMLVLILPAAGDGGTGLSNADISVGAVISLFANGLAYVFFSMIAPQRLVDRMQAQAFVFPKEQRGKEETTLQSSTTASDLITLLTTFMGSDRARALLELYQQQQKQTLLPNDKPTDKFLQFCERALGGVIGASSAQVLIDTVVSGKKMNIEEVVNVFDDTTQAIQFNQAALFTSLESLEQGISVVDGELNLVAWNKKYMELFSYPEGMITVGTPVEELVRFNAERGECGIGPVEDLVHRRLEHLRRGLPHRFVRQRSDGKVIEMVGNPLPGGGFVTSFHDITTHMEIQQALEEANIDLAKRVEKRTEEVHAINAELRGEVQRRSDTEQALVQARHQAEKANASKTRFLALASHDVLQPLNAAKLYLSALKENDFDQHTNSIFEKLEHSVQASEAMIATLLDVARLDQGNMQPTIEPYSLTYILNPLVDEFSMKAEGKGLELRTRLQDVWVKTDRTYLHRIVRNLLSNAVKYSTSGTILLSVRRRGSNALVQVWDTGLGIGEDEQKRVFKDFYRVENGKETGMGLGLGVVSRLSDQLDANISLRSIPGKGSCFSLYLPVTQAEPSRRVSTPGTSGRLQNLKVLCVDDQQANLDAVSTLLNKWQVEAVTTQDINQAKAWACEQHFDLILADYQLEQGLDGLGLIASIREALDSELPAALMTANREPELIQAAKDAGITYLSKPVKPAKLRALLQSLHVASTAES